MRILRRPRARQDLLDIWLYISDESEPAADRLLDRVEHALKLVADNPMMGRARSEISPGLRSITVANYIVFYRVALEQIVLTRVLSGYRDFDTVDFG